MPRTTTFVLTERWDAPATLSLDRGSDQDAQLVPKERYSRHHVVGRKYLQMLMHLLELFEFVTVVDRRVRMQDQVIARCDPRIQKFAEYRGSNLQALKAAFFWSPWNLFVGPMAELRTFDPSSGVEQVRPKCFPEKRWNALKMIPETLEQLGVVLANLVILRDNESLKVTLKVGDDVARQKLDRLLEKLKAVCPKTQVGKPFRFNPDEWAVVDTSKDSKHILQVTNASGARTQYAQAVSSGLIAYKKTWKDVADQMGTPIYKMILKQ